MNLTLRVLGKRSDGYHALDSLVAFASVSDRVALDVGKPTGLDVTGPFAADVMGVNILEQALDRCAAVAPPLQLGRVLLEKNLPVASGIGGGSADAAALLRAILSANPQRTSDVDWDAIARALGADVPVCYANRATWMGGAGEQLIPLPRPLPHLDIVLANPLANVPSDKTARVFRALGAAPINSDGGDVVRSDIPDRAELLALIRRTGNDLEVPAISIVPETQAVLDALEALPGVELAQMSGAGPTCFAVFPHRDTANAAAAELSGRHPSWWIAAATVG